MLHRSYPHTASTADRPTAHAPPPPSQAVLFASGACPSGQGRHDAFLPPAENWPPAQGAHDPLTTPLPATQIGSAREWRGEGEQMQARQCCTSCCCEQGSMRTAPFWDETGLRKFRDMKLGAAAVAAAALRQSLRVSESWNGRACHVTVVRHRGLPSRLGHTLSFFLLCDRVGSICPCVPPSRHPHHRPGSQSGPLWASSH